MPLDLHALQDAPACIDISYKLRDDPEAAVASIQQAVLRPNSPFSDGTVSISVQSTKHPEGGYILGLCVKAHKAIELVHLETKYNCDIGGQRMLANGFQSWSQACEMDAEDRISAIRQPVAYMTKYNLQGDYNFFQHSGEKGQIHSSSYTHFRDMQNHIKFMGSLSEQHGYTYFKADFNKNTLRIYKDIKGKAMDPDTSIELVRVLMAEGDAEAHLWDLYASFFPDQRALKGDMHRLRHVNGWTSWYNYYGDVSESIVLENLEALQKHKYSINIFQIDDGFQTAIGDWLSINSKFPNKLTYVAEKIQAAGYTPGLWLAPYAVGFTSKLAADHPDWLVIDPETQKPVVAGPNWGGFYALDMYHPEARKYLKDVFDTVLREWGFGMVKLDFLFAAAMIPRLGKSRGEIMWDAMQFVRELTGSDKLLLGCGVPLACAWRTADYCRIGSDVAPWWEDTKLKYLHVRERVSTANSLRSTLSRWPMSDRMFGNDPDVMILRDTNNKLSHEERYTLCVLNNVLGALVFSSDNVEEYGDDEHLLYRATFPKAIAFVQSAVEIESGLYKIDFKANDFNGGGTRDYTTYANLSRDDHTVKLPSKSATTDLLFGTSYAMHLVRNKKTSLSAYFNKQDAVFFHPASSVEIKSHETRTFMHLPSPQKDQVVFMGSTSHIVPGSEIDKLALTPESNNVELVFHKDNTRKHRTYLTVGEYFFTDKASSSSSSSSITPPTPAWTVNGAQPTFEYFKVHGNHENRSQYKVLVGIVSD